MKAGELDRRVDLQSATATNDPDYNEETLTWATYATVWAKVEYHNSQRAWREEEDAGRMFAERDMYISIRWRDDVTYEHRLVFENNTYQIIGRPREIGRREGLKLQVRLVE